jgi:cytochrome P450
MVEFGDAAFFFSIALSFIIGASMLYIVEQMRSQGPCGDIPGSYGFVWIGEALDFYRDPVEFVKKRFLKHGKIFRSMLFGQQVVFIRGARAIELFTAGPSQGLGACQEAYLFDHVIHTANSTRRRPVLMSESDHQHSFKHLAMLSAITMVHNQPYLMDKVRDAMIERFQVAANAGEAVSGAEVCRDAFLHVSVSVFLREVEDREKLKSLLTDWLKMNSVFPIPLLGYSTWNAGLAAMRELDAIITKDLRRRQLPGQQRGEDVLGCMLKAAEKRTADGASSKDFQDILEKTVLTDWWAFIRGVCESTAAACTWLLVCFEQSPAIKQALLTEVRNFKRNVDFHCLQDASTLPYLDATAEEALRVYGFLNNPNLKRVALFDIEFEGHVIPIGTRVYLPIQSLNFEEDYFPSANTFDPLRFMDGGVNQKNGGSYTFGLGHHACPGGVFTRALVKLFTFTLLNNFDFSAVNQIHMRAYPRATTLKIGKKRQPGVNLPPVHYFPVPQSGITYQQFIARHHARSEVNVMAGASTGQPKNYW